MSNHYKNKPVEIIKVINVCKLGFNLGNLLKYVDRVYDKDTIDSNKKKAHDYMDFEFNGGFSWEEEIESGRTDLQINIINHVVAYKMADRGDYQGLERRYNYIKELIDKL